MNSISELRLKEVYPVLANKIRQLAGQVEFELRVTQGLRTWQEQDALYAQSRTKPGAKVTNARGGYSWHNFGLAVDIVPMDPLPDWNINHPVWKEIIQKGEALGLYSGSEFRSFPDYPHFQLTGRFPVGAPNDEVRELFKSGGLQAVWNAVAKS